MSRKTNWVFTDNNPLLDDEQLMRHLQDAGAKYCCFQKEQGEQGTIHWQGYVQFRSAKTLGAVKLVIHNTTHWEPQRGTNDQAREYCKKPETRIAGPYEWGTFAGGQGSRTDIIEFRDAIRQGKTDEELLNEFPVQCYNNNRFISFVRASSIQPRAFKTHVVVLHGAPGTGKTRRALAHEGPDRTYVCSRGDSGRAVWWDGYNPLQHTTVVLDDFYAWLPWSFLLQLLDRYAFRVEVKGGSVTFRPTTLFITSNTKPEEWYDMEKIKGANINALLRRIDEIHEMN